MNQARETALKCLPIDTATMFNCTITAIINRPGGLNLYSLIYPLANFKVKFTPLFLYTVFSLLQMPIIGKRVNFLLTKFTPKAGQIYPWLIALTLV